MKTKKLNKSYLLILAIAAFASSCGINPVGSYVGTETINSAYQQTTTSTTTPTSNQATLYISNNSSNNITGSYQSSTATGTLTGTMSNDGTMLMNVQLNLTPIQSMMTYTAPCAGTFSGILSLSSSAISGTLNLTQSQYGYGCTSRALQVSKH